MISLIICSRQPDIPQLLKDNIAETIGVEYELVVIGNSENQYSIFQAYNEGVRRANYPLLCFMHEDILFHTEDWGVKVIEHFKDDTIGLIGLLGTHFLPSVSSYWIMSPFYSETMIQNTDGITEFINNDFFFYDNNIVDAVACDGVCMFVKKELFQLIEFDEKSYSGFHFYDMDICMQVLKNMYRVCLVRDILIEHYSGGNYDNDFYKVQEIFFNKWKMYLPIQRGIEIPEYVVKHLSSLIQSANDARVVRGSLSYRIGKKFVMPLKVLFKKNFR